MTEGVEEELFNIVELGRNNEKGLFPVLKTPAGLNMFTRTLWNVFYALFGNNLIERESQDEKT